MNRTDALALVKHHLTQSRYEHTIRVTDTAIELAKVYKVNIEKTEKAAIFHDYAKYRDQEELRRWIVESYLPKDLLFYHHELWHGPVGALLVQREIGINDTDVLSAIKWHTTGHAHMSLLEKIIFIADYIEPGRRFPGVEEVRNIVNKDIDLACWMALKNTIIFLLGKNQSIYPDTFHAYNYFLSIIDQTKLEGTEWKVNN